MTCVFASLQISGRSGDLYSLYAPLRKYPFYAIDGPDVFSSVRSDQNVIRRKYAVYSKTNAQYSWKLHGNLGSDIKLDELYGRVVMCDRACAVIFVTVHWFSSIAIELNWKFHVSKKKLCLNMITNVIKYLILGSGIPWKWQCGFESFFFPEPILHRRKKKWRWLWGKNTHISNKTC